MDNLSYSYIWLSSSWIGRENDTKFVILRLAVVLVQMTTADPSYKYYRLN